MFDGLLADHGVHRQAGLEINDWLGALTMVQRGPGVTDGPWKCVDGEAFGGLDVATLAGASIGELGIATGDDALRGAAGRAILAAHREQCL